MKFKLTHVITASLACSLFIGGLSITATKDVAAATTTNKVTYYKAKNQVKYVFVKVATKTYKDVNLKKSPAKIKVNSYYKVKSLKKNKKGIAVFRLSNGKYVAAQKNTLGKVTKNLAKYLYNKKGQKVQLTKKLYVYPGVTFAKATRLSPLPVGTQLKITAVDWTTSGYPRLKVAGGYISSAKTAVKLITPPKPAVVINSTNPVNQYIQQNYLKKNVQISSQIWAKFPKNKYRKGAGKPEGVVVHETANPTSTITNEIAYMKAHYNNAFVHTFVDDNNIINIANTNYLAWGSGYYGNQRFVQFEQVRVHSKDAFAKEINNAAYYTAYVLKQYGLTPSLATSKGAGTVWSHHNVSKWLGGTNHTDPDDYWKQSAKTWYSTTYTMADFLPVVQAYYNSL